MRQAAVLVALAVSVALLAYWPVVDEIEGRKITLVSSMLRKSNRQNGELRKKPIYLRVKARDLHDEKRLQKRKQHSRVKAGKRRILVTGAAGFIGSATARRFRQRGDKVVGIDNMNNYYDVKLKRHRAAIVEAAGVKLYIGDVCSKALVRELFKKHRFTHVVHLAAQAGVRYSIGTPPFAEDQVTDSAASLYALTKQSTEGLAYTYHHQYDIYCTGLRFFTVYGPMGRPDMTMWLWTDAISSGKPIKLYKRPDGGGLFRDFTYIEDIINGIEGALEHESPFEIFNLGRGMPLPIERMIELIELETHKKATIKKMTMPAADVPITNCDVMHAHKTFGYKPVVTLEQGVASFVKWYLEYKKDRWQGKPLPLKNIEGSTGIKIYAKNQEFAY